MLKLEIKLDDPKILADGRYQIESIYEILEQVFADCGLRQVKNSDGTMVIYGGGDPQDYGAFGGIITSLKEKPWFINYVMKWIWYNSDDCDSEDDFAVEDVLSHYTNRSSVA